MIGSHFEPELAHLRPARSVTVMWMSLAAKAGSSRLKPGMLVAHPRFATARSRARARATGPALSPFATASEHRRRSLRDGLGFIFVRIRPCGECDVVEVRVLAWPGRFSDQGFGRA